MKQQNDQKKNKNQCNRMCPDFPVIAKKLFSTNQVKQEKPIVNWSHDFSRR